VKEKRIALVIGNGEYRHGDHLRNPTNDANAIATILQGLDFEVTKGLNLGRDGMENVLFAFEASLNKADAALFFFAGHAIQLKGENYLLPVDANIEMEGHLRRRTIGLNDILEIMVSRTGTNLIFLDACRNNPFALSLAQGLGERAARFFGSGLAEVCVATGTFISFATAPDRVALDGKGANSTFTMALLKGMSKPGLSINDMMADVIHDVASSTGGKQQPWQQSSLREKFYFRREETQPKQQALPSEETKSTSVVLEHEYWASTKDKLDPSAFERFLSCFPHGDFAALAADCSLDRISACTDAPQLERLLKDYPDSPRAGTAKARLALLLWGSLEKSKDIVALEVFIARFQKTPEAEKARARLAKLNDGVGSIAWLKRVAGGAAMVAGMAVLIWQPRSGSEEKLPGVALATAQAAEQKLSAFATANAQQVTSQQVQVQIESATDSSVITVFLGTHNRIAHIKAGGGKEAGQSFRDCEKICPEMVVVPEGKFIMGSPPDEPERDYDEGPEHPVTIPKSFAVGKYAVTFEEWDACAADGGCDGYTPADEGWGRGSRPVINVSWDDAHAYAQWLSRKTGKTYRLLSDAEREYATRAGTTTPFWWGTSITPDQANYSGNHIYKGGGNKGEYRGKTLTVNSFEPNPWGLYQVHGNVWEWVQDCHVNNYLEAPADGSPAKETHGCVRVLRGGSWFIEPGDLRAANRSVLAPTHRDHGIGIRVARTL
jgi:formylglycine-generating enzyme required for sulfatase activity